MTGGIDRWSFGLPIPTNVRQCRSFFNVRESPTTINPLQYNTGEGGGEGRLESVYRGYLKGCVGGCVE